MGQTMKGLQYQDQASLVVTILDSVSPRPHAEGTNKEDITDGMLGEST